MPPPPKGFVLQNRAFLRKHRQEEDKRHLRNMEKIRERKNENLLDAAVMRYRKFVDGKKAQSKEAQEKSRKRENLQLVERLKKIHDRKPPPEQKLPRYLCPSAGRRRMRIKKINHDNKKIAELLDRSTSHYRKSEWDEHARKHEELLGRLCAHPRIGNSQNYVGVQKSWVKIKKQAEKKTRGGSRAGSRSVSRSVSRQPSRAQTARSGSRSRMNSHVRSRNNTQDYVHADYDIGDVVNEDWSDGDDEYLDMDEPTLRGHAPVHGSPARARAQTADSSAFRRSPEPPKSSRGGKGDRAALHRFREMYGDGEEEDEDDDVVGELNAGGIGGDFAPLFASSDGQPIAGSSGGGNSTSTGTRGERATSMFTASPKRPQTSEGTPRKVARSRTVSSSSHASPKRSPGARSRGASTASKSGHNKGEIPTDEPGVMIAKDGRLVYRVPSLSVLRSPRHKRKMGMLPSKPKDRNIPDL